MCLDVQRVVAGVEYATMAGLLADFRRFLEQESDGPIERLETNSALLLNDLCTFLGLTFDDQRKVLGKSATAFVERELAEQIRLAENGSFSRTRVKGG